MAKPSRPSTPGAGTARRSKAAVSPASAPATSPPVASAPRTIPSPPGNLNSLVKRTAWPASDTIHRVHRDAYDPDEFNPGPGGNARFSPIADARGASIPTIYGGTTFECAAMETVFHDVPHQPGLKSVAKRKLRNHQHSQLQSNTDLTLADLTSKPLRKLGIARSDLIDSEKDIYPQTRPWAEAIYAQCQDVQGLLWVSRQDDGAKAVILFGDRLPPAALGRVAPSNDIVADPDTYAALVDLAEVIGVKITGK